MSVFSSGGYIGDKKEYPTTIPIVTSGLTLHLDAANRKSYPRTGAFWYDISGFENHFMMFHNPTFSTANEGVMQFNGTSFAENGSVNYTTSSFTIMAASRYSAASPRGRVISSKNNWILGHWSNGSEEYHPNSWVFEGTANDESWRIYAAVENYNTDQRSFYVNNVAKATNSAAGTSGFQGMSLGNWSFNYTENSVCEISFILVYNRLLSTDEMTQNYNALRGRFGL